MALNRQQLCSGAASHRIGARVDKNACHLAIFLPIRALLRLPAHFRLYNARRLAIMDSHTPTAGRKCLATSSQPTPCSPTAVVARPHHHCHRCRIQLRRRSMSRRVGAKVWLPRGGRRRQGWQWQTRRQLPAPTPTAASSRWWGLRWRRLSNASPRQTAPGGSRRWQQSASDRKTSTPLRHST
jgi:hypothetical protein